MQIVCPEASIISVIIGAQHYKEEKSYRLLHYVARLEVSNGLLLYNAMTKCMVLLSREESLHILEIKELVDLWFLVPEENDDKKLCNQIRHTAQMLQPKLKSIKYYTILPTTDCNARCFYCFERGVRPVKMNNQVADKVFDYIKKHHGNEKVHLRWFGGEPLYNYSVIDNICNSLTQYNISYTSKMVSNGYLFDEELINRAKVLWNLERIQITIDGTEDIYNNTKAYIYKEGNAYRRVLRNIQLLLEENILVVVRLTMTPLNTDDLYLLVDEIYDNFGSHPYIRVYAAPLFEKSAIVEHGLTSHARAVLFEKQLGLIDYIHSKGLGKFKIYSSIRTNACMSDSGEAVLITPEGNIGLCDHHYDRNLIGHIDTDEINNENVQKFKLQDDETDACKTCLGYPDCFRLSMCAEGISCQENARKVYEHKIHLSMFDEYQNYLRKTI